MADAPQRPQRPRGTRDFKPSEMRARRRAEATMRRVFAAFGYQEVATPTFEELALFTAKSGEGIKEELYAFKDKAERDLTLRPELTAPVIRFYYAELAMEPKPLRLYYYGNCFRYDRPQKGRYREFWQMGCELVGPEGPAAGAEVVALGLTLLMRMGVPDLAVRLGHLGILKGLLSAAGVEPKGEVMRKADKRDIDGFTSIVTASGASDEWRSRLLALFEATTLDETRELSKGVAQAEEGVAYLEEVLAALPDYGIDPAKVAVDPAIARGLDYYTGLVFEMDCESLGAEKQLLGGGAYDLAGVFGGAPTGSMGFGLGFDRTLLAAGKQAAEAPRADIYILGLGKAEATARKVATSLRDAGVAVDLDVMGRKPGKALQYANGVGIPLALVIGEKELEAGIVKVKQMASGEETEATLGEVGAVVARMLSG